LREIGVFCGTFNPIHLGHLLIAECARDQFSLEKVIFITSPRPPHRIDELIDGEHRHLLVSAAVAENPHFECSRIEIEREGPSYTSDTVRQLIKQFGGENECRVNLILGADNIAYLGSWHESSYLLATCRILVAPRLVNVAQEVPGLSKTSTTSAPAPDSHDADLTADKLGSVLPSYQSTKVQPENQVLATVSQVDLVQNLSLPNASIETIVFPCVSISSSAIRLRLAEGRSVLYMVPPAVNELLLTRKFYDSKHK
jgi:nicotinate (nicotinamide) nucleotide adenylyltransferase